MTITMTLEGAALSELARSFRGQLVRPGGPPYDQTRRVWNANIDKYPAIIARCTGVADVLAALRYAREQDLLIAVRGGGHSIPGLSTYDDGIVIDLGPMKGVRVDPAARTATVGPGVIWREFDRETQQFGLATPGGTVSDTGIAGLTLGGGLGMLSRRFGLTSDNLVAADVITADGRCLRVSESEHADLLWGLRGGGGNFGIVTSFTFRLHELSAPMLSAPMIYPIDGAVELVRFACDWADDAPDAMSFPIMFGTARRRRYAAAGVVGALDEGDRVLAPLRAFRTPVVDLRTRRRRFTEARSRGCLR